MPLTVVGGLPAVGKTAVCREVLRLRAESQAGPPTWLRIDSIEQALRDSNEMLPGMPAGAGYYVAAAVARDVLTSGGDVLVECVNPLSLTRRLWEETASALGCRFLAVEIVCSDKAEHRRRVQQRVSDIEGLELPDWRAVERRDYAPWPEADLHLDTARLTATEAARAIVGLRPADGTR
ncbi:AAA family ATPase [Actinomyces sp. HMSC075C01]|uniref:AAA family ATPase n=1 Tax=Actinomyces oris TaxID=544580 RepID=A0A1Q8VWC2_9ACTO|nr:MULTISPECIES: AAA family ATPase [Actinomyces]OFR55898.1 AAA family ATPase [Actinomyces sp. HMSC075C01]OLO52560.1 AAA family ATPase [Actinomyces oris]